MDDFNITNFLIAEAATAGDYFVGWIVKGTSQKLHPLYGSKKGPQKL